MVQYGAPSHWDREPARSSLQLLVIRSRRSLEIQRTPIINSNAQNQRKGSLGSAFPQTPPGHD